MIIFAFWVRSFSPRMKTQFVPVKHYSDWDLFLIETGTVQLLRQHLDYFSNRIIAVNQYDIDMSVSLFSIVYGCWGILASKPGIDKLNDVLRRKISDAHHVNYFSSPELRDICSKLDTTLKMRRPRQVISKDTATLCMSSVDQSKL